MGRKDFETKKIILLCLIFSDLQMNIHANQFAKKLSENTFQERRKEKEKGHINCIIILTKSFLLLWLLNKKKKYLIFEENKFLLIFSVSEFNLYSSYSLVTHYYVIWNLGYPVRNTFHLNYQYDTNSSKHLLIIQIMQKLCSLKILFSQTTHIYLQ